MYGRLAILVRQVGLAERFSAVRRRKYWTGFMDGMSRGLSIIRGGVAVTWEEVDQD